MTSQHSFNYIISRLTFYQISSNFQTVKVYTFDDSNEKLTMFEGGVPFLLTDTEEEQNKIIEEIANVWKNLFCSLSHNASFSNQFCVHVQKGTNPENFSIFLDFLPQGKSVNIISETSGLKINLARTQVGYVEGDVEYIFSGKNVNKVVNIRTGKTFNTTFSGVFPTFTFPQEIESIVLKYEGNLLQPDFIDLRYYKNLIEVETNLFCKYPESVKKVEVEDVQVLKQSFPYLETIICKKMNEETAKMLYDTFPSLKTVSQGKIFTRT